MVRSSGTAEAHEVEMGGWGDTYTVCFNNRTQTQMHLSCFLVGACTADTCWYLRSERFLFGERFRWSQLGTVWPAMCSHFAGHGMQGCSEIDCAMSAGGAGSECEGHQGLGCQGHDSALPAHGSHLPQRLLLCSPAQGIVPLLMSPSLF